MKYSTRQYVLPTKGKNAGVLLRVVEIEAQVERGPYHLSDDRWYPENELLSIPEFKDLQAENERLKSELAEIAGLMGVVAPPDRLAIEIQLEIIDLATHDIHLQNLLGSSQ